MTKSDVSYKKSRNPTFLIRNPTFLIKNPTFLIRNLTMTSMTSLFLSLSLKMTSKNPTFLIRNLTMTSMTSLYLSLALSLLHFKNIVQCFISFSIYVSSPTLSYILYYDIFLSLGFFYPSMFSRPLLHFCGLSLSLNVFFLSFLLPSLKLSRIFSLSLSISLSHSHTYCITTFFSLYVSIKIFYDSKITYTE